MIQFFYTQEFSTGKKLEDGSMEMTSTEMSFNPALVLFSIILEDGRRKVIFNDWHEEMREEWVEKKNAKGVPKPVSQVRKVAVTSDVILSIKDGKRFKDYTDTEWLGMDETIEFPKEIEAKLES